MPKYHIYKTPSPVAYHIVEDGFGVSQLPAGAELVFKAASKVREEARTEIDRFLNLPPYLEVRKVFQDALAKGLPPSKAVRTVHQDIGEVAGVVWPDHFHDALGTRHGAIASLFVSWWPTSQVEMTDAEFDARVFELIGNA